MPKTNKDQGKGKEEDAASSSSSAVATTTEATTAPAAAPAAPAPDPALLARIKAQLAAMGIRDANERQTREAKERYAFWETQPVVQFKGGAPGGSGGGGGAAAAANGSGAGRRARGEGEEKEDEGPIDAPKTVADVKKEPYALAPG